MIIDARDQLSQLEEESEPRRPAGGDSSNGRRGAPSASTSSPSTGRIAATQHSSGRANHPGPFDGQGREAGSRSSRASTSALASAAYNSPSKVGVVSQCPSVESPALAWASGGDASMRETPLLQCIPYQVGLRNHYADALAYP